MRRKSLLFLKTFSFMLQKLILVNIVKYQTFLSLLSSHLKNHMQQAKNIMEPISANWLNNGWRINGKSEKLREPEATNGTIGSP
jgi:hypothetical protein